MTLRAQTFAIKSRTGGNSDPDWAISHSLAADGPDQTIYVLVSWTGPVPGYPSSPGSKRIELADFMATPSAERDSLFGLMRRLVPGLE